MVAQLTAVVAALNDAAAAAGGDSDREEEVEVAHAVAGGSAAISMTAAVGWLLGYPVLYCLPTTDHANCLAGSVEIFVSWSISVTGVQR
jgi:hypothetical protein